MYKNVLQNIPGIEFYPIIALVVFFAFWAGVMVWFFRADKRQLDVMARLPLDTADTTIHESQPGVHIS